MALGIFIYLYDEFILFYHSVFVWFMWTTKRQKLQQHNDLCIFFIKFIYRLDFLLDRFRLNFMMLKVSRLADRWIKYHWNFLDIIEIN